MQLDSLGGLKQESSIHSLYSFYSYKSTKTDAALLLQEQNQVLVVLVLLVQKYKY